MIDFPAIKQEESNDCGIVCVNIIANYLNITPYDTPKSKAHFSIDEILGYAKRIGLEHFAFNSSYSWLVTKVTTPFIVHWNGNHFVVVAKISKTKVVISDPATGTLKTLVKKEFVDGWLGHIKDKDAWKKGVVIYLEKKIDE